MKTNDLVASTGPPLSGGVTVIPAQAGIQAIFMHSGEPKAHEIFAQDDKRRAHAGSQNR